MHDMSTPRSHPHAHTDPRVRVFWRLDAFSVCLRATFPRVLPRRVSSHRNIIGVVAMDCTLASMPIMMEAGACDMFTVMYDTGLSMAVKIRQVRNVENTDKQEYRHIVTQTRSLHSK